MTDKIADGIAVEGMESLAPVLVDDMELLVDLLPDDTHVLVLDPERVRTRAHDLVATSEEFLGASWAAAAGGGTAPIDLGAASYRSLADVREPLARAGQAVVVAQPRSGSTTSGRRAAARRLARSSASTSTCDVGAVEPRASAQPAEAYRGDIERASPTSQRWLRRRLPRRRRAPGPRPGAAAGRGAGGARRPGPAGRRLDGERPGRRDVVTVASGCARPRLRRRGQPARRAHRRRPVGPEGAPPATCARCRPAASSRSTRSS